MAPASALSALAALISEAALTVDSVLASKGLSFPDQNAPTDLFSESETILNTDPAIQKSLVLIATASYELLVRSRNPMATLLSDCTGHLRSAALRLVIELNIAEILREAGPDGLPVAEIAKRAKTDSNKIARVLRFLASIGIFVERAPGEIFANNRLSSVLDRHLPVSELQSNPEVQFQTPAGAVAALIAHLSDEGVKAAAYLPETILDPETASSGDAKFAPVSRAFTTGPGFGSGLPGQSNAQSQSKKGGYSIWDIYEAPGQQKLLKRFNLAMEAARRTDPPDVMLSGFDWSSLPDNARVVDVGGGTGSVSLVLAKAYPKLKIVVQDRPSVVEDGLRRWKSEFPEAIESGRVTFQAQDFFEAQPPKSPNDTGPTVYLLKFILHDWSDEYCTTILRKLRDAADSSSKLIVVDKLVPFAVRGFQHSEDIPGLVKDQLPEPLPANLGGAYPIPYLIDMNMLNFMNGQERTLAHQVELFRGAGWKIERVFQKEGWGQFSSQILAVPI